METPIEFKRIDEPSEYMDLVGKVSYLVDFELKEAEALMAEGDAWTVAYRIPKLLIGVNMIRDFRENFLECTPPRADIQKALYANQDFFEARLSKVVDFVKNSPEAKEKSQIKAKEYITSILE
ncbi:MAG TPA: hypothetical protein VEB60_02655 [Candidatus Paceibacterota bacterium]|nr:hypothetical protein [Candidatus Paceibacterota bacterium]